MANENNNDEKTTGYKKVKDEWVKPAVDDVANFTLEAGKKAAKATSDAAQTAWKKGGEIVKSDVASDLATKTMNFGGGAVEKGKKYGKKTISGAGKILLFIAWLIGSSFMATIFGIIALYTGYESGNSIAFLLATELVWWGISISVLIFLWRRWTTPKEEKSEITTLQTIQ